MECRDLVCLDCSCAFVRSGRQEILTKNGTRKENVSSKAVYKLRNTHNIDPHSIEYCTVRNISNILLQLKY